MTKRENDAVTAILANPENTQLSAEEVASRVIEALDAVRLRGSYPKAVGDILTDPDNAQRSPGEIARDALDTLEEIRSRTHRLAVVGQIQFKASGPTHTVILGPFSSRGVLDTEEKLLRATEGGSAARQAGQDLAWDTKTGKGRGRFMLAPAFLRPRAAWDFYRKDKEPDERYVRITEQIAEWQPGLWAERRPPAPSCICGLRGESFCHAHPGGRSGPLLVEGRPAE